MKLIGLLGGMSYTATTPYYVRLNELVTAALRDSMARLIDRYPEVDAVILACTELPLVAPPSTTERPIINPAELQCRAAVEFALA